DGARSHRWPDAGRRGAARQAVRRLLTAVLVAAAYVATGRMGQILAIPPGHVTAVWPPSGIALAAVLLAGGPGIAGGALGSLGVILFAPLVGAAPAWWRGRDKARFAPLVAGGVSVTAAVLTLLAAARGESRLVSAGGPAGSRLLLLQGTLGAAALGLLVLAAS